jgi:hypothetical protein
VIDAPEQHENGVGAESRHGTPAGPGGHHGHGGAPHRLRRRLGHPLRRLLPPPGCLLGPFVAPLRGSAGDGAGELVPGHRLRITLLRVSGEDTPMADRHAHPDAHSETGTGAESDRGPAAAYPGTPRWVKVLGIAALVVILLVLVVMLAAGGQHGPDRHLPSGDAGGQTLAGAQGGYRPELGR